MRNVVRVEYPTPEIAKVIMEDRDHRNTFSKELIQGLTNVFKEIEQSNTLKVVVIHGYDNYFCCGGTKDELLDLHAGKLTFADLPFYRLLLDCPLPVIAAMQGHGIGGGLAFGCYADIIVMADECVYATNFMKYGFTPGMGSTYIIPKKFGEVLGNEMLFSARNYFGVELKARGVSARVVKKAEVISTAMTIAEEFAEKPVVSLKILKKHLSQTVREMLPRIIEQELKMHEETFKTKEVKERIESLF